MSLPAIPPPAPGRRRVVYALNSYVYGGVEEHVALLCGAMPAFGYDPVVIYTDTQGLKPFAERLDRQHTPRLTFDQLPGGAKRGQLGATQALARGLRDLHADVMHLHLIWHEGGRVPLLAARLARVPTLVTHHVAPTQPVSRLKLWSRSPLLGSVARFIAVSEANRRVQQERLRLPPARLVAVHNGIVPPVALPNRPNIGEELRRELGIPLDAPLVGCVGRLVPQKGHHWLLEAAPAILARVPETHFVCIGEGELLAPLQQQAAELGVAERFHWPGFRPNAGRLLAGIDVLAMPSNFEGLPIVLLEAMAAATPIVAYAVDGIPEAVTDGVEGFLVTHGDAQGLADRLAQTLADPGVAYSLGQNARARILRDFTVEVMAQRIAALYDAAGSKETRR